MTRLRHGTSDRWLEYVALAVVVAAPLMLGSVHPFAIAATCAVALVLAVAAPFRGVDLLAWTGAPVAWGLLVWGALSLVPVPPAVLAFAPFSSDVSLSVLAPLGLFPSWRPVSLAPATTALELAKVASWLVIVGVLASRARYSPNTRLRLVVAVAMTGGAVVLVGLLHAAGGLQRFLGLGHSSRGLVTTFVNGNHLGGFLNCTGLVSLGLAVAAETRRAVFVSIFIACAVGTLAGDSTGATIALAAGTLVFAAIQVRRRRREDGAPGRRLILAGALVLVSLAVVVAVVRAPSRDAFTGKIAASVLALRLVAKQPLTGIGRGAFGTAHVPLLDAPSSVTFTHVEMEPLQAAAELGVPAAILLCGVVGLLWWARVREGLSSPVEAGVAAGAAALLLQSLVDFSLQYACGFVLLALLARPPAGLRVRSSRRVHRWLVSAVATVLLVVGISLAWRSIEGDEARLQALLDAGSSSEAFEREALATVARHPMDHVTFQRVVERLLQENDGARRALPWLNGLLWLAPNEPRGHVWAGEAFARLGRRVQALGEYRRAAALGFVTMWHVAARYPGDDDAARAAVPDPAREAVVAADVLLRLRRRTIAEDILLGIWRAHPEEPSAAEVLHRLYVIENRFPEALAVAVDARRRHPNLAGTWVREGEALFFSGRREDGRALLVAAASRFDGAFEVVSALVTMDERAGDLRHALEDFGLARADGSVDEHVAMMLHRGRVLAGLGRHMAAYQAVSGLVPLVPSREDVRLAAVEHALDAGLARDAARLSLGLEGALPDRTKSRLDDALKAGTPNR